MNKVLILVLGLMLTAASCDLFGGSGVKGVLKSEDGGDTFVAANKLEKKGDISGLTVNTMILDPNDGGIVYVGSGSGMHRSGDGAKTWAYILNGMKVGDIAIDPGKTDIIYAAGISGQNGRIIKTTDGGATWKDIYTEPSKNNPALSLAISKANSKVILAGLNSGEVIRSVDEGKAWQVVRDLTNPVIDLEYVDSTTVYALTKSSGLYVSADQGSTWNPITIQVAKQETEGYTISSPTASTYYDVAFDSRLKGVYFVASAQGLLRTIDNGATWTLMSLPVINQTLNVSAVAINPTDSNNIYIAVGGTIFESSNGGISWETKKLPTQQIVKQILINPDEPNNIYLGIGS